MNTPTQIKLAHNEVIRRVKEWKENNERAEGETLAEYRDRAFNDIKTDLTSVYGGDIDWLEILLVVLRIVIMIMIFI